MNLIFIIHFETKKQQLDPTLNLSQPTMKPQNEFQIKALNEQKIEQSIRLMEYINMYNLKKDQINYQCSIYKSQINDEDFDLEVQCVEEMNDLFIIYRQERKVEFTKIRQEQERLRTEWLRQQQARKKETGFFGKLFKSQSKEKKPISESPSKLTLKDSMLKSSAYVAKIVTDQAIRTSQLKSNNSSNVKPQIRIQSAESIKNLIPDHIKANENQNKKDEENKKDFRQKENNQNIFDENQLLQINEDELLNLNDSKVTDLMSKIEEDEGENASSFRDSKASRVSIQDLQDKNKGQDLKGRGRLSKRSRKLDSDQEQEKEPENQIKPDAFKKREKKHSSQKNPTHKTHPVKKEKSPKKEVQKFTTHGQNQDNPLDNRSDRLSSYIQKQISRLSEISHSKNNLQDSQIYSRLSSADIISQLGNNRSQMSERERQKANDSYRDINIDWFAKIEACQLQEKLLMNRFENRWKKPLKTLSKIQNLRLSDLTQQLNRDPKYRWSRPNLNFGKIIQ